MKDGFYAFSVKENKCIKMIHNPGILTEGGITTFDESNNIPLGGKEMKKNFDDLQKYSELQKIIPDSR